MSRAETEVRYAIGRRIEAEERALDGASLVVCSTSEEVAGQWGAYCGYDAVLAKSAASREALSSGADAPPPAGRFSGASAIASRAYPASALCLCCDQDREREQYSSCSASCSSSRARSLAVAIIPPGVDFSRIPLESPDAPADAPQVAAEHEPPIWAEISKFLRNPRKPAILALARPDAKKNLGLLMRAFGANPALRELANLVIVCGNRTDMDALPAGAKRVVEGLVKLVDTLDLYGSVALPKRHGQDDVPALYGFAASTKGVFVNVALNEPYGLTLIEAAVRAAYLLFVLASFIALLDALALSTRTHARAPCIDPPQAHGLPTVATCHGGPVDIEKELQNGLLVEPTDAAAVGDALLRLVTDRPLWSRCRASGLARIRAFSWAAHGEKYVAAAKAAGGGATLPALPLAWKAAPSSHGALGGLGGCRSPPFPFSLLNYYPPPPPKQLGAPPTPSPTR